MPEIQNFRGRLTLDDIIGFLVDFRDEVEKTEKELEKANSRIKELEVTGGDA